MRNPRPYTVVSGGLELRPNDSGSVSFPGIRGKDCSELSRCRGREGVFLDPHLLIELRHLPGL
jgi:hypothetical protein